MSEPEDPVLALLRNLQCEITDMRATMATRADIADLHSEMTALEKRLSEQIGRLIGLRRAVMESHSSTIGHGVLIGQLEDRLRRVEQHLNLPPFAAP